MRAVKSSCTCRTCQSYCHRNPGWFRPRELTRAAAFLGLSVPQFFRQHLVVDWWSAPRRSVFILRPRMTHEQPGQESPADMHGTCAFLRNGRCQIHAAKPFGCAVAHHRLVRHPLLWLGWHTETIRQWRQHQPLIARLLRRAPRERPVSLLDVLLLKLADLRRQ